ncbi:hypothetical protein [Vallitalea guaymasensis]|uniref:Uncharacterized protein n=1 Tax=Vallitalea guaymasensis TaxID=1185412 RepID=A0A8J8SCU8_9FIRM|nr:hypothetical protein [Vallitalea guaymasensis]QUH30054.1 hypothetical protein HYG85_14475 [Vallitalea guaymasensis]
MKNDNREFKILTKKKYWLIIFSISIVLVLLLTVMELIIGNEVMIQEKLYMFISLVFCIFIITLLISLIRYTIRDFRESNRKGKLFIVILLILFTLKAIMEILKSR